MVARTLVSHPPNPPNRPTHETRRLPGVTEAAHRPSSRVKRSTFERCNVAGTRMCQRQLASGVPGCHATSRLGRRARNADPCRAARSAGQKWPAGTTSVLRRRAKRRPATASSPGREGGRSRRRRLGGRASDSPATAHQRAVFWWGSPAASSRVLTDALGRGPHARDIGVINIGF